MITYDEALCLRKNEAIIEDPEFSGFNSIFKKFLIQSGIRVLS